MKRELVLRLAAAAVVALSWTPAAAAGRYNLFISPMGEPFRADVGKPFPSGTWFAGADANHDGVLTKAEFLADAERFFKKLDRDRDGKIRDDEITYYEKTIAPEIVANSFDTSGTKPVGGSDDNSLAKHTPLAAVTQGAANFSPINDPEPVRSADADFNFRITHDEWMAAAAKRFRFFDKAGKGSFTLADIPPTPSQGDAKP